MPCPKPCEICCAPEAIALATKSKVAEPKKR